MIKYLLHTEILTFNNACLYNGYIVLCVSGVLFLLAAVCPKTLFHPGLIELPLCPWGNIRTRHPLITTLGLSISLPSLLSSLRPAQPWGKRSRAVSNQWTYKGSLRIGLYAMNWGAQISVDPPGWTYCWTCHRPALRLSFVMPGTRTTVHSMFLLRRTTS